MSEILFLGHRLPFPPDRGDKIRSYHVMAALSRLAPVHVGCFAETDADEANASHLGQFAHSYHVERRSKSLLRAGIEALGRQEPVSTAAFRHAGLAQWVDQRLASGDIDTIYVFSGQMGQYVPRNWQRRLIVDLVDVDSAKFAAYAAQGSWPMRWVNAREAKLLAREEQRLARQADRTLLVSEAEAEVLREKMHGLGRVEAMPMGVDFTRYDPALVAPHPQLAAEPGPHLVFTGQMDYAPNVAACLRTIERLLPAIRRVLPTAQFHVVGRAPVAGLLAHDGRIGCRVWGEVADVRPFLAAADLVVAPLTIARGVQNKVLEAMAMARPVLLTTAAAAGIDATDQVHFTVADSDADLIATAVSLLSDRAAAEALGRAGRQRALERMSWGAALSGLPQIVGLQAVAERRDAA